MTHFAGIFFFLTTVPIIMEKESLPRLHVLIEDENRMWWQVDAEESWSSC